MPWNRAFNTLLWLIASYAVFHLLDFSQPPHLFGWLSVACLAVAFLTALLTPYLWPFKEWNEFVKRRRRLAASK